MGQSKCHESQQLRRMTVLLKSANRESKKKWIFFFFLFEVLKSTKKLQLLVFKIYQYWKHASFRQEMSISMFHIKIHWKSCENRHGLPTHHRQDWLKQQFCHYYINILFLHLQESKQKSDQVPYKPIQIKTDTTSSSCTMEAKRQERGMKHTS